MKRDGFVFYRSFFEALNCLDDEEAFLCFKAITKYALDGEETELKGAAKALFISVKPQIDANNKRYLDGQKGAEFGKLGGRPKKKNPSGVIELNPLGVIEKTPKEKDKEKEKEKDKEKDKEKVKEKYGENNRVTLTLDEYNKLVTDFGYEDTQAAIQLLDDYIVDKGYKSKSNYAAIRRWVMDAVRERKNKKAASGGTADDWFRERGFL